MTVIPCSTNSNAPGAIVRRGRFSFGKKIFTTESTEMNFSVLSVSLW